MEKERNQKAEVGLSHIKEGKTFKNKSVICSINYCQRGRQLESYRKLWDNNGKYLKAAYVRNCFKYFVHINHIILTSYHPTSQIGS